jgi:Na+-driven multidrug efflux pump
MSRAATMHRDDLLLVAQNENDTGVIQFRNETAEKILDEIKAVDAPFFKIPLFTKIKLFCNLIFPSCLLAITHSGNTFLNTMGFYIAGTEKNTTISTAFGLTVFFNMITVYSLTQPIIEKIGIACAKSFGAKDYEGVKEHFLRGIIMFFIFTALIYAPIVVFAEDLMIAIRIDPEVAETSADYQALLFPIDITRLLGEILVTYMVSQGIESSFGVFTMINSLIGMGVAYMFGVRRAMGVQGWMLGRAIFDLLNILSILGVYAMRMKGNKIKRANLRKAYTGLGQFFCDVVKYTIVLYSEVLGWEISTLLVAMTEDKNQIAAFSSIVNLAYIVWNIGNGFSNTARTRINYLLGQKKGSAAKNFFAIVLFGMIFFAISLGVIFYFGRETIGRVYASENFEIRSHVVSLLQIYGFLTIGDFLFAYMFTITRSTNQVLYNMFLDYVFLIGLHAVVSFYIVKYMHGNCRTVLMCVEGSLFVVYVFLFIKLFSMDWNTIEFKDEEGSPDIEDHPHQSIGQETSFSQEGNEPLKAKR